MRYLSVCSGIEAASVAWEPLGWEPVGFSEIEAFPSAVLAHRFPNVRNYGDMTKHETWDIRPGSVDVLVGGTPCQSFSVAGLRGGLSDPRGGLMLTYLAIAQRLRPQWIVWENVPGVLSSGGGRDFGSFLGALGELGYGWAYRVLDAQYVRTRRHPRAVPQRRRRVFVVGCLRDWRRAAEVLFESQSMRRDTSSRGKAKQGAAGDVAGSLGCRGGGKRDLDGHGAYIPEIVGTLSDGAHMGGGLNGQDAYSGRIIAQPVAFASNLGTLTGDVYSDGTSPTMRCGSVIGTAVAFSSKDHGADADSAVTPTLRATQGCSGTVSSKWSKGSEGPSGDEAYNLIVCSDIANPLTARMGKGINTTLDEWQTLLAYRKSRRAQSVHDNETWVEADAANTINCFDVGERDTHAFVSPSITASNDPSRSPQSSEGTQQVAAVYQSRLTVRRITVRECERLQGFPDDWTMIPWRGRPAEDCPDGPRYRAVGNSMAVNCMEWLGQRIADVEERK